MGSESIEKKHVNMDGLLYLVQKIKLKFTEKVDKVDGKQLSTNDLTDALKQKILDAGDSKFSGSYNDLSDKPKIPAKASDLANDAGYQTAAQVEAKITGKGYQTEANVESTVAGKGYQTSADVESAVAKKGYQTAAQVEAAVTKKGYQTAVQVQSAVAAAGHITKEIVQSLPAASAAKENVIYMVPKAATDSGDAYDEYMLIAGKMEKVGDSRTDLTGYLKESDLVAVTNAEIDTVWNTVFGAA